jgi:hypothetical protein
MWEDADESRQPSDLGAIRRQLARQGESQRDGAALDFVRTNQDRQTHPGQRAPSP